MRMFRWQIGLFVCMSVLCCLQCQAVFGQAQYTVTDLGTLGGSWSQANALNNLGQVVGASGTADNKTHAFLYSNGRMVDISPPALELYGDQAQGINDSGDVVGYRHFSSGFGGFQGFLYHNGTLSLLQTPHVGEQSVANGINNHGQIVGATLVGTSELRQEATIWNNGIATDFGIQINPIGFGLSTFTGINDTGLVIGSVARSAFFWQAGKSQFLTGNNLLFAVNAQGTAAGIQNPNTTPQAIMATGTTVTPLPTPPGEYTEAYGINNAGNVVGLSYKGYAFLFDGVKVWNLNALISPDTGWNLAAAVAINDQGQIAGTGTLNGQTHAFLLSRDSDGDGVPDEWERNKGYWYNRQWISLPDADPHHKDIYVFVDYMVATNGGHSHKPNQGALNLLTNAFANAPILNPDGTSGITLHICLGSEIPETNQNMRLGWFTNDGYYDWSAFDSIKYDSRWKSLNEARSLAYHYCLFAHDFGNNGADHQGLTVGVSRSTPGNDFCVALGGLPNLYQGPTGTPFMQALQFMHELGHNLGLRHGGLDDNPYKPNYLSVMSYLFNMNGLIRNRTQNVLDYSRFELPTIDEQNLNEMLGLSGGASAKEYGTYWFVNGQKYPFSTLDVNAHIDWNNDGTLQTSLALNISRGSTGTFNKLYSFNDWENIYYQGGNIGQLSVLPLPMVTPSSEPGIQGAYAIPPLPPTGLTVRTAPGAVRLSWAIAGLSTDIRYNVYRRIANGAFLRIAQTASPLLADTGIGSGSSCSYYVTVLNMLNVESGPSNTVTVTLK